MGTILTIVSYFFGALAGICAVVLSIGLADTGWIKSRVLKVLVRRKWNLFITLITFTAVTVTAQIWNAFIEPKPSFDQTRRGGVTEKTYKDTRVGDGEQEVLSARLKSVVSAPKETFTNSLGMKFVFIKPGAFRMGSSASEPKTRFDEAQHKVTLTKGFYMGATEVTQGQWKSVMGSNPSVFSDCGDNCPVENVTWNAVHVFVKKLNDMEGGAKYRLPTEAEWEYACRAGTETPFSFGKCLSTHQANYKGDRPLPGCRKGEFRRGPLPVGSFSPNDWGLHDMHGNVWEWCQDWYEAYPTGSVTDPEGPPGGSSRVIRGGCWGSLAAQCRSASRDQSRPDFMGRHLGFRIVREQ